MTTKTTCKVCRGRGYKPTGMGGNSPTVNVPCEHCMERFFTQEKRINAWGNPFYKTGVIWIPKKEFAIPQD